MLRDLQLAGKSPWARAAIRIARRLLGGVLMLVVLSLACFALIDLAPGDFLTDTAMNPQLSPDAVQQFRDRAGLAMPFWQRYARWLQALGRGQLGTSLSYGVDASELLLPRLLRTALLNASSIFLALALALPLGLFAARFPRHSFAKLLTHATQSLLMVPEMVLALLLVAFAVQWGLPLPGSADGPTASGSPGYWGGVLTEMAVPCLVLVLGALPVFFRHIRSAVQQALAAPFVASARQAGLSRSVLYFRYVLPAASNPLVSLFGLTLGGMLSASLVVETITSWPGMGPLLLEAVLSRDTYVVVGAVLIAGAALLAGNLVADFLLLRLDPRIRR